jgi:hypothetical protein
MQYFTDAGKSSRQPSQIPRLAPSQERPPMKSTTPNVIARDLVVVNQRLDLLRAVIALTPSYRKLSFDYLDKLDERQRLLAQRDRLLEEARINAWSFTLINLSTQQPLAIAGNSTEKRSAA